MEMEIEVSQVVVELTELRRGVREGQCPIVEVGTGKRFCLRYHSRDEIARLQKVIEFLKKFDADDPFTKE